MSIRNGGQEHRKKIGKGILNSLSSLLESAGIAISQRHNARYTVRHWVAILAGMCSHGCTSETAARDVIARPGMPTARWFRGVMNGFGEEQADRVCGALLAETVRLARGIGMGMNGPVRVAIDKHLIPRYDRNNMDHLVYSEPKSGTKRFEAYATLQVVGEEEGGPNAVLDGARFVRGDSNVEFVSRFMRTLGSCRMPVSLVLMDREFYAVDVMLAVSEAGRRFLMPAVKNSGIRRAILEHHDGRRDAASRYVMRNSSGRSAEFTLLVRPAGKAEGGGEEEEVEVTDRYVVFATNLPPGSAPRMMETLPEEYRKRRGIETGYRQFEQIRPRTTSRSGPFRWILFFVAMYIYNMWAIERFRAGEGPVGTVRLKMVVCATVEAALADCSTCRRPRSFGGPG